MKLFESNLFETIDFIGTNKNRFHDDLILSGVFI